MPETSVREIMIADMIREIAAKAARGAGREFGDLHRAMQSGTVPTGIPESLKRYVRGVAGPAYGQVEFLADIFDPRHVLNAPANMRDAARSVSEGKDIPESAARYLTEVFGNLPGGRAGDALGGAMVLGIGARMSKADRAMAMKAKALEEAGVSADQIRAATAGPGRTGFYRDKDDRLRFEISDAESKIQPMVIRPGTVRLDQVLYHDDLYKRYPQLRDLEVTFFDDATSNSRGSFGGRWNRKEGKWEGGDLKINLAYGKDKDLKNTLLHEVQHAVQDIEGFAMGGNTTMTSGGMLDLDKKYMKRALDRLEGRGPNATNFKKAMPWLQKELEPMVTKPGWFKSPQIPKKYVDASMKKLGHLLEQEMREYLAAKYNKGRPKDEHISYFDIPDYIQNESTVSADLSAQLRKIQDRELNLVDKKRLLADFHNWQELSRDRAAREVSKWVPSAGPMSGDNYETYRELLGELEANMTGYGNDLSLIDLMQPANAPWRRRMNNPDVVGPGRGQERVILPRGGLMYDETAKNSLVKFDNPAVSRPDSGGREWLQEKQRLAEDRAKSAPAGTAVKNLISGAMTAWTPKPLRLPVKEVARLRGARHEIRRPGEFQYDALAERVAEEGWSQGDKPILIEVNHKGQAFITEGNTRVAYAARNGIADIVAEVRWLNGGEAVADSRWSPEFVDRIGRIPD